VFDKLICDVRCRYRRELLSLSTLRNHPHVVGLKEAYLTPHHLAIVMEYAGANPTFRQHSLRQRPYGIAGVIRLLVDMTLLRVWHTSQSM
jgi:serine/threonine protein kinase